MSEASRWLRTTEARLVRELEQLRAEVRLARRISRTLRATPVVRCGAQKGVVR